VLAITGIGDYSRLGTHRAHSINIQPPRMMATKKTAKTAAAAKAATPVAKKTVKKAATKKAAAPKAAAPKEVARKAAAAPKEVVRKAAPKASAKPTPDELARAAYLNYRRRTEHGLPGDSHGDWLEAERHFQNKG